MTIRNEDVSQLISMGFPEEQARNALQKTGGNVEIAVDRLLSGEDFGSDNNDVDGEFVSSNESISRFSSTTDSVVRGSTSQYSYGSDGRSACTCIALTAAEIVANADATNDNKEGLILTTEFLDRAIEEGVARYTKLRNALASSSSSSPVEHLSADEVLLKDDERATSGNRLFDLCLNTVGGGQRARQGALSRDVNHPLGMKFVLEGLVNDIRLQQRERNLQNARDGSGDGASKTSNVGTSPMICILITKSPETVLLCLPPTDCEHGTANNSNNGVATQKQKYWLVDSHPRPQLLPGVETSYAKPHDTFDALLRSLRDVFPFTDLGPDVPSMMSDMYNMFDMYALEGRKHRPN